MEVTRKAIRIEGRYFCKEDISHIGVFCGLDFYDNDDESTHKVTFVVNGEELIYTMSQEQWTDFYLKLLECGYKKIIQD